MECSKAPEAAVNRYVVLYLATLIVIVPVDFLFLGIVAKGFFTAQVGDMLGEIRPVPAVLFYLLYVVGILISSAGRPPRHGNRHCPTARCLACFVMRRLS